MSKQKKELRQFLSRKTLKMWNDEHVSVSLTPRGLINIDNWYIINPDGEPDQIMHFNTGGMVCSGRTSNIWEKPNRLIILGETIKDILKYRKEHGLTGGRVYLDHKYDDAIKAYNAIISNGTSNSQGRMIHTDKFYDWYYNPDEQNLTEFVNNALKEYKGAKWFSQERYVELLVGIKPLVDAGYITDITE